MFLGSKHKLRAGKSMALIAGLLGFEMALHCLKNNLKPAVILTKRDNHKQKHIFLIQAIKYFQKLPAHMSKS